MLRDGLLAGRSLAVADAPRPLCESLLALGASLSDLPPGSTEDWARAHAPLHGVLYDGRRSFAAGGLAPMLEQCWTAVRSVAIGALIPSGDPGRVILIAPAPAAGSHASAAREALVNLVRTLSVEWARYRITTTAILPATDTSGHTLGVLIAFLASPAGDYFSGCRLELGAVREG